jgi:hypothetical protein
VGLDLVEPVIELEAEFGLVDWEFSLAEGTVGALNQSVLGRDTLVIAPIDVAAMTSGAHPSAKAPAIRTRDAVQ